MQDKDAKDGGSWWEVFGTFFWALVIAMIFRSFLFQPFHIPSGSMKPTLLVGDYLVVSKYTYGYSRYSFPFGPPIFEGRKFYTEPKRGDIVVFKVHNRSFGEDVYIKRLVGLPGDEMQMKDGILYINNKKLETVDDGQFQDGPMMVKQLIETLPNGIKHKTLDEGDTIFGDNTEVYKVPPDHFFMMGDNRDNSKDSRWPVEAGGPGMVPKEDLIGRAEIIMFSSDGPFYNPKDWRLNRFFTLLR